MTGIRPYHVDLGQKDVRTGMYDGFVFDAEGIPAYRYGNTQHYNPTFVGHYGLYQVGLYLRTRDEERLSSFLRVADWFLRTGRRSPAGLTFEYTMDVPGLPTPWISALGQGRALSVLTRAYGATADERYREAALDAFGAFRRTVSEGGVVTAFPDGGVAFEEYPRSRPDVVLNGLITALFGLYDLAAIVTPAGPGGPKELFDEAVASLERNLYRYDLSYWSAYDLSGRVCSNEYHAYHVILLWALHELTGVDAFAERAARWDGFGRGIRLFMGRNLSRIRSRLPG